MLRQEQEATAGWGAKGYPVHTGVKENRYRTDQAGRSRDIGKQSDSAWLGRGQLR